MIKITPEAQRIKDRRERRAMKQEIRADGSASMAFFPSVPVGHWSRYEVPLRPDSFFEHPPIFPR